MLSDKYPPQVSRSPVPPSSSLSAPPQRRSSLPSVDDDDLATKKRNNTHWISHAVSSARSTEEKEMVGKDVVRVITQKEMFFLFMVLNDVVRVITQKWMIFFIFYSWCWILNRCMDGFRLYTYTVRNCKYIEILFFFFIKVELCSVVNTYKLINLRW